MKNAIPLRILPAGALFLWALLFTGCTITPVSSATVYITPSSATVPTGQQEAFSVYVNEGSGPQVVTSGIVWEVNGLAGGNTTFGTTSGSGLYTAPVVVPAPNTVTVCAVQQGSNLSLCATVAIVGSSPIAPTAMISVSQSTILDGDSTTLNWSSSGMASCLINQSSTINGVSVGTTGSVPVSPTQTTIYQLDCNGPNGTASDETTLTVQPSSGGIAVSITPTTGTLTSGMTMSFSATVLNDPSGQGVHWSSSLGSAPAPTGPLTANYAAPSVTQNTSAQITASSVADPSASATATITVVPTTSGGGGGGGGGTGGGCTAPPLSAHPPQATISPALATMVGGSSQPFTASLSGDNVTSQAFTWSLNVPLGAADAGTVSSTGPSSATYTATNVPSVVSVHVVATSVQYTCITASALVTVDPY